MTGYDALRGDAAWIDLSDRGKVRVTGEDRARLLHAMSTNDVQNLLPFSGLYAFFLSAQGRILADAYIYNLGESFLLDTEPETVTKLREHLDKFIIADDAYLEDETSQWATVGLEGPRSIERAQMLELPVPDQPYSLQNWDDGFVARVAASSLVGVRIFLSGQRKQQFLEKLASRAIPKATPEEARIVRIENGIPRYGEEVSERYLVQETQQLQAVHTQKGCYIGQEIVERVRSRGQVHRLLMPIRVKSNTPPAPGTKLQASGKDVAEISSAVYSPALGEVVGLAYVRTEAAHTKPELVVSGSDPGISAYIP